jgi:RNA polymerase sigma-70 factor (ECF subfamily)
MNKQQPDKTEFSALIEENQALLHKVTLVYANNAADRDDLFQEICLQLWRSYASFKQESQFATWMYRVSLNTAISLVRKRKNSPVVGSMDAEEPPVMEPATDNGDLELLHAAISKLRPIEKAIILLWLEEKDYEEIASIVGITKSNVSVRLVRIKRKLKELVQQSSGDKP